MGTRWHREAPELFASSQETRVGFCQLCVAAKQSLNVSKGSVKASPKAKGWVTTKGHRSAEVRLLKQGWSPEVKARSKLAGWDLGQAAYFSRLYESFVQSLVCALCGCSGTAVTCCLSITVQAGDRDTLGQVLDPLTLCPESPASLICTTLPRTNYITQILQTKSWVVMGIVETFFCKFWLGNTRIACSKFP